MKEIDLSRSVYDLTEDYPELINLLKDMGFLGVVNPVVRNTLGRTMTLPAGCQKMGKDLAQVKAFLEKNGFVIK